MLSTLRDTRRCKNLLCNVVPVRCVAYDLAVVGGGPGGYVASIKAAQLGLKVACIEQRGVLGGTCLNVGCIPSKTLLELSRRTHDLSKLKKLGALAFADEPKGNWNCFMEQKAKVIQGLNKGIEGLLRKNKVEYIKATAVLTESPECVLIKSGNEQKTIEARNIILATGSIPSPMPGGILPIDEKRVLSSSGLLNLSNPPKKLVIVGAGIIGLELGSVMRRMGTEVTVVEFLDRIAPNLDADISKEFQKLLEADGFKFHLSSKVTSGKVNGSSVKIDFENLTSKQKSSIEGDCVLISVGRSPYSENLGLEKLNIQKDKRGCVLVDSRYRIPNQPNIRAIGDLIPGPMLAHKAEDEAIWVAHDIANKPLSHGIKYEAIPGVVYTHPEVACVGPTEESLKKEGKPYKRSVIPLMANSRVRASLETGGLVKLLADEASGRILGGSVIAASAGEMIHEVTMAAHFGLTAAQLVEMSHAHPTVSESIREAAMQISFGKAIHL